MILCRFLLAIDELHVIIPDTELYASGLSAISPHVDVYWHNISSQPITTTNNNGSEQIGQTVTTIFNHGTQEIVNKYHSDLDPKMKDNSVCLTSLLLRCLNTRSQVSRKQTSEETIFLEHFLYHDNVARASENWCRHLVCRVIQQRIHKLSKFVLTWTSLEMNLHLLRRKARPHHSLR